jgi:hypothetical protein
MQTRNRKSFFRVAALIALVVTLSSVPTHLRADTGTCVGVSVTLPFTDVMGNAFFCQIAEAYFSGLTNGTTATTYSPSNNVTREQMAAFITRTLDQSLSRGSRRAALGLWWRDDSRLYGPLGVLPAGIKSDGQDLWVTDRSTGNVLRVRASDGKLLETWTGAGGAYRVLVARGYVFVTDLDATPGRICRIDPRLPAGAVTTTVSGLPGASYGVTCDGRRLWVAQAGVGSISVAGIDGGIFFTVSMGLVNPLGIIFDGKNIWVSDYGDGKLKKLDSGGQVIQAVAVGTNPGFPVFDGTNIWVPNTMSNTVTVIRAATGAVLATLSGNNLNMPLEAAFDGERVLVTNSNDIFPSMWKATDLSPIEILDGAGRQGFVCSDGVNFWMTRDGSAELWRY